MQNTTTAPALPTLRPYQEEILKAIELSVFANAGLSFSVMISRQGGKNEISARLELDVLLGNVLSGGSIVKTAPTSSPQLAVSRRRLIRHLKQVGMAHHLRYKGDTIELGQAGITFLSGQPDANVMGHTASLLLEVDEAQHLDPLKFERDFRPMILSTGATVVFYGTAWQADSLLERVRERHLDLQRQDGIQRHFQFDYKAVGRHFPGYEARALEQRAFLGDKNPVWLSQYRLQSQRDNTRLFTAEQIEALHGHYPEFPAPNSPSPGAERAIAKQGGEVGGPGGVSVATTYVAGLDIGGHLSAQDRDPTVLTVARVTTPLTNSRTHGLPRIEVIKHLSWQTSWQPIQDSIARWDKLYRFDRLAVDSTGIGHYPSDSLAAILGSARVLSFNFTERSKSELCYELRDAVDAARLTVYNATNEHTAELWRQLERASVEIKRGAMLMGFHVPEHLGHDDYLVSLALCVHAANQSRPRIAIGLQR
ncbi:MAG: hypothetical protein WEB00_10325 [Dehalococcoidia bacterium]